MNAFIDEHRARRGIGPICAAQEVAPSACRLDRVNRQFQADRLNQLGLADFSCVWTRQGFVHVAFVIDVFARCIVGRRVSRSMPADFVLDAPEQRLSLPDVLPQAAAQG